MDRVAHLGAFVDAGVAIALASDFNPGTCYCENLQTIVSLACQEMRLTPVEALRAATLGGACALGLQGEVGSLEAGKRCDLVVLAAEGYRELPYHFGVNLVDAVVVDGKLVVSGGTPVTAERGGQGEERGGRTGDRAGAARGRGATS